MKNENELLQEAYELNQAGMPGACLTVCQEIKTRPNHSALAYYYAGVACIYLGRIDQAIAELKEAVRREPENANFHATLASAYSNQGGFPWARRAQKQALREASRLRTEADPEWQRQMTYGKLAEAEGRWDRALACYRLALPAAPDPQFVQTYIGRALNHLGRWEEAREALLAVVSRPTGEPTPWIVLGQSEWKLGNREAAAEAFERATALHPYDQRARFHLARVSFKRGQWRAGFRQAGMMWRLNFQTSMQAQEEAARNKAARNKAAPKKSPPKG